MISGPELRMRLVQLYMLILVWYSRCCQAAIQVVSKQTAKQAPGKPSPGALPLSALGDGRARACLQIVLDPGVICGEGGCEVDEAGTTKNS